MKPGDEWGELHQMLAEPGGNPRVTFPLKACMHSGGRVLLRAWAEGLRGLANRLEMLSGRNDMTERECLFYAGQQIRLLNRQLMRKPTTRAVRV
jgi:hypothetical protein